MTPIRPAKGVDSGASAVAIDLLEQSAVRHRTTSERGTGGTTRRWGTRFGLEDDTCKMPYGGAASVMDKKQIGRLKCPAFEKAIRKFTTVMEV
jgi:hypothetical protein